MFILNWYVTKNFLATFLMAILILTFGMTGAQLMKVFDFIARGIPLSIVGEFLLYSIPMALAFTVPWAGLVSIMLVFGRMSADNEITAMRACGVSILQIISPIILTTFLLTCVCLYLQLEVGPRALGNARELLKNVASKHPLALFTPGLPVDVDRYSLYFDEKDEDGTIYGVQLLELDRDGTVRKDVYAARGRFELHEDTNVVDIVLYDAVIDTEDNGQDINGFASETRISFEFSKAYNQKKRVSVQDKYLTVRELLARSAIFKRAGKDTTAIQVELNQRIALAIAPIAFLMLGMPLAIRTSRRETSIGLFLSVALASIYYFGVLISDALRNHTNLFPQYVLWIPPILYQVFGVIYLTKIARK